MPNVSLNDFYSSLLRCSYAPCAGVRQLAAAEFSMQIVSLFYVFFLVYLMGD